MSVPTSCSVLVIGGGPGGSYAATVLAREGVDTVLLEADVFPRYHIGESFLASFRYFLRFIDLDSTFDSYGFVKKFGAAFKVSEKREGYTDFGAFNGPDGYSWNVIRSESDELMFKHAASCGVRVYDGTKVDSINFEQPVDYNGTDLDLGRPISAKWSQRGGTTGNISFDYLVDASGRAGVVSTKYMKNRNFNQSFKNVATWGYWKGAKPYGAGTTREGQPFFEALKDGSGWCWNIPLHDGTISVGVVMMQDRFTERKKAMSTLSGTEFYCECVKMATQINDLTKDAELVSSIRSASDWSYTATKYASKYLRIVGDAGCFIDPYFSSGVHLALASALSAAVTIQAARTGDCDEDAAAKWHSSDVADNYNRFLVVVVLTSRQIEAQRENILSSFNEDGVDQAFACFQPVIQGNADANFDQKLHKTDILKTLDFCATIFNKYSPEDEGRVIEKMNKSSQNSMGSSAEIEPASLTDNERPIWRTIKAKNLLRYEQMLSNDNYGLHEFDGLVPRLQRGSLGLTKIAMNGHS